MSRAAAWAGRNLSKGFGSGKQEAGNTILHQLKALGRLLRLEP